jgi:hypothetical protein
MPVEPGALLVILLYLLALYVILVVSPRIDGPAAERPPWWRNPRFWASFVAVAQIIVYALWS